MGLNYNLAVNHWKQKIRYKQPFKIGAIELKLFKEVLLSY